MAILPPRAALPRIVWVLAWRWFGVALAVAIGLPVACTSLTPALLVVSVLAVLGPVPAPATGLLLMAPPVPCWAGGCDWAGSDFGNLASFRFRTISDYIDLPPASLAFLASSLSTHCCPSGLPGLRQRCPILSGNSSRCWSDQPIHADPSAKHLQLGSCHYCLRVLASHSSSSRRDHWQWHGRAIHRRPSHLLDGLALFDLALAFFLDKTCCAVSLPSDRQLQAFFRTGSRAPLLLRLCVLRCNQKMQTDAAAMPSARLE